MSPREAGQVFPGGHPLVWLDWAAQTGLHHLRRMPNYVLSFFSEIGFFF
jgi:hypothetical protein